MSGGVGIDLEQKVKYTGDIEDNGKVVSFDGEMIVIIMNQITCLALQSYGGAELYRGTADLRLS